MRSLNLLIPPFAMSIKIKTIAMPISERQNKSKAICNLRKYYIQKYGPRNIVYYVTGNVQNVVPGENLPLVFSSETTICDLYDKKNINSHTC